MKYEIRIKCQGREEALALKELLADIAKAEIVCSSDADDYAKLDVSKWPSAVYMMSRMDATRWYDKEQLGLIIEEMGWSHNTVSTLLIKLVKAGQIRKSTSLYKKQEVES